MSAVFEDRNAYLANLKYYNKREHGDFTPFYIAVTICTIIGLSIFLLNIFMGCCSRYSSYWNDRHTGNRWIISFWTSTPHNQPPLDLTELEEVYIPKEREVAYYYQTQGPPSDPVKSEFVELQKRESDI